MFSDSWISASPPEFRRAVLSRCQWRRHATGTILSHIGADQGTVYGLASGTMAFSTTHAGAELRLSHIIHSGDWVGVGPALTGRPRTGQLSVRAPSVIAHLSPAAIDAIVAIEPSWWREFGRLAIIYGDTASIIGNDLMIADNRQRCAATLLRLAGIRHRDRDDQPALVQVGQDELGAIANLSRNSVNRILGALEAQGLVRVGYRTIALPDPAALRRLIEI
ncbi:Crp/Fnr family transcriptional regulator [Sandarakinorhabdus sp. DWP1-3-1]|uniref:Crp/Fnr family transcriptional regulator n=1 Tax=Sandarakinorhabdus sp. DWP1-3-1 TaxID=2804627 RepID=UPI003CF0EE1F